MWVAFAALLVFLMTIAVGFLEIGLLGESFSRSLLKTVLITGSALLVFGFMGFNVGFAPTLAGVLGDPLYSGGFMLGGLTYNTPISGVWWSMGPGYFGTGLAGAVYFFFEDAFAAVTLALVGLVVLHKVKLSAFAAYSVAYFLLIWTLPAAWIWNPTGWLYALGVRDFAGGLVVHGAAGAAALGILYQVWREERARGLTESPKVPIKIHPGWLTLSILLLWVGWFGFNAGSVLAFNAGAMVVAVNTFVAASAAMFSVSLYSYIRNGSPPTLFEAANGVIMGLIVITPLAGFVSPTSAVVLGVLGGPLFVHGLSFFERKWYADPLGILSGHTAGGIFGLLMIGVFAQNDFAAASGNPTVPDGLLFGGGAAALHQLGLEALAVAAVMPTVFALSYAVAAAIARAMGGITTQEYVREYLREKGLVGAEAAT